MYPWFHDVEREEVDRLLNEVGEQGCFLVRISRRGGPSNPFTLSLLHEKRIFHLNIRKRPDGAFALGSAKSREKVQLTKINILILQRRILLYKWLKNSIPLPLISNPQTFETVVELIDYHRQEEILLTSRNQAAGSTRLTATYKDPSKTDVEQKNAN